MRVVFCCPTVTRPYQQFLDALEASVPALDRAGIEHYTVWEIGNPYISSARAKMLRKALDKDPDCVVFLDHDLSWRPEDLVKLVMTDADVCAGTYRYKEPAVEYMCEVVCTPEGRPVVREDGCIEANKVPGGFLKVTTTAVDKFMRAFPELVYGPAWRPFVDLFNHGAHKGVWWGEDYAFCRRWKECGGDIWLIPDLDLTHWGADGTAHPGNYHQYLLRCPGGALEGK